MSMGNRSKSSRKRRVQQKKAINCRLEMLESRDLLTGDLTNALIDDISMHRLTDGLGDVVTWVAAVDQLDAFTDSLGVVTGTDGGTLTLDSMFDFQASLDGLLSRPTREHLESLDPATRDSDALVSALDDLPGVTVLAGGVSDDGSELRFDVEISDQATLAEVAIDLGIEADTIGLRATSNLSADLIVDVQYTMSFGVLLDTSLTAEQAFFLRDTSIHVGANLHTSAAPTDLDIGILDTDGIFQQFDVDFDVELTLNDVVPDPQQNITLSEINGFSIIDLANVQVSTDAISATLTTNPVVGGWTAPGTPTITINASTIGEVGASISTNVDYAELLGFSYIDAEELYDGLGDLVTWLQDFGGSTEFYQDLPFVETDVASAFDPSVLLQAWIDPLTQDGVLEFEVLSELESALGIDFNYDPSSDRLVVPVNLNGLQQVTSGELNLDGQYGLADDIQVDAEVQVEAAGSLDFELVIDLSDPFANYSEQVGVADFGIEATLNYEAANLSGSMSYGIVGLDFENASVTGSLGFTADIQNPYDASAYATVAQLYAGLFVPSSLLTAEIEPTVDANVDFGTIRVRGGLFAVDDLTLELQQVDFTAIPDLHANANAFLDAVASIDMDMIATQLHVAAIEAQSVCDFSACWTDLIGVVPVVGVGDLLDFDLGDFLQLDAHVQLQDLPSAVAALPGFVGLSPSVQIVVDESNSTITFNVELTQQVLGVEHEFGLSFGAGLGDAIGSDLFGDIGEFGGTGGLVEMDADVEFDLDVQLDFSGADVEAFVLDSTGVTAEFVINEQVSFAGSLNILGAEFEGSLVVAGDATSASPSIPASLSVGLANRADGRYPLDGSATLDAEVGATGALVVSYDFTVTPNLLPEASPLRFEITDLNDAIGSLNVTSSPDFVAIINDFEIGDNLATIPNGILAIIDAIADAADDGIFGIQLPVIGDLLEGDGNFLRDLYNTLLTEFGQLTDFGASLLEDALEEIIVDLLQLDPNEDRVDLDLSDLRDILLTLDLSGGLFETSKNYDTDLGFPALGASLNAEFGIDAYYDAVITFGLDAKGVYLLTEDLDRDGNLIPGDNLGLSVDVNIVGDPSEPDFEGRLGFIQVEVDNGGDDTVFHADYDIDITEPSGDGKLHLDELSLSGLIDLDNSGLRGGTGPDQDGVLSLDIGVSVAEWAPSLYADLEIEWHFDGFDFKGDTPRVEYTDVGVEMGDLIDNTICPFVSTVREYTAPLDPVVDVFETRIDIISDVLNRDITILDLANVGEEVAGLINADRFEDNLRAVTTFVEVMQTIKLIDNGCARTGEATVSFGSLSLQGIAADATEVALSWLEDNAGLNLGDDPLQALQDVALDFYEQTQEVSITGLEVAFPLLENPLSGFEWLLGIRHVPIVTLDVVDVSVNLELPLTFPIGPIYVGLEGGLEIDAGLAVGFDTLGFSDFFDSGNRADLFNGFYISDGEHPDGSGRDIPEISIVGSLAAVAGIGFEDFGAGVYGGLFADIEVDLLDHDNDGRMRGYEFLSEDGCIEIDGGVDIEAGLEANALGLIDASIPLGSEEIASFGYTVYCAPVQESPLAHLNTDTNTLTLLVGDDAHLRTVRPDVQNEYYELTELNGDIVVSAFGKSQLIRGQVDRIVGNAGSGDDTIIIDSTIEIPAELDGGSGENRLVGGSGDDTLIGGNEADDLRGGDGNDTINAGDGLNFVEGGDGIDTITGGDDRDEIYGGAGDDTISGLGGDDLIFGGGDNDTIFGGWGQDYIDGEGGNDTIEGNEGDDELFGGPGVDTIEGNQDADFIDGGSGGDFLYGNNGPDTILGGSGPDEIRGGNQDDTIRGGDGDDDIEGGEGADTIHGDGVDSDGNIGSDNDTIKGDAGDDMLFGNRGQDDIDGGEGSDTIEGNDGNDNLAGNEGDDVILGGIGNDTLEGGTGDDELYGEDGDDTIYGNEVGQDGALLLVGDRDVIYGGDDDDTIFGQAGADLIFGEGGEDTLSGGLHDDEIYGGKDGDTIRGDAGEDLLFGEWGGDLIEGGDGNDHIRGMTGNDRLFGDDGEDEIFADDGADYVAGGLGDDIIDGGRGDDEMYGNSGQDLMHGGLGDDLMDGNDGDDLMYGQSGDDTMYGSFGKDVMYGGADRDLMYGDDGDDQMFGGSQNDTMRGGNGIDIMEGNAGDDLMLGNAGDDLIDGDDGNDVLRGNDGNDTLVGDLGDDRIMGGDGDDEIQGDQGNDILEGDDGNDTLFGGIGNDELFGDDGVDTLDGGADDDYLWAGTGIGNTLLGGSGNDMLIGSDDGQDDPNFNDNVPFGDVMMGGDGDDYINGLGGGDRIEGGSGNDELRGGPHGDLILAGPNMTPNPDQDIAYGGLGDDIMRGGAGADQLNGGPGVDNISAGDPLDTIDPNGTAPAPLASLSTSSSPGDTGSGSWASLDGSASTDGLSQVGGFEQTSYAADNGVYVAWVDVRNGNSEIYVAYRADGSTTGWQGLAVSDGGLSDDANASRRPAIVRSGDHLLVSWTNIDAFGNQSISVSALNLKVAGAGWFSLAPPVVGQSDHSVLVPYPGGAMLAWLSENPVTGNTSVLMSQFVDCDGSFLGASVIQTGTTAADFPVAFELDADGGALAASILVGEESPRLLVNVSDRTTVIAYNCPAPGGGVVAVEQEIPIGGWRTIGTFSNENMSSPTIAIGGVAEQVRDQGPFEKDARYAFDVYVAWDYETDRENQVEGRHGRKSFEGNVDDWNVLVPDFQLRATPRADTVSETPGYAAAPSLVTSFGEVYLAWMDDSVHQSGGNGDSSIYVMSSGIGSGVMIESEVGEASGRGISVNGGALQDLNITVEETEPQEKDPPYLPYVSWTDAYTGQPQIYLRHDLNVPAPSVRITESGGATRVRENQQEDTYEISLTSQPDAVVVVVMNVESGLATQPASIEFSPTNWAIPQTVTVRAEDNDVQDGNRSAKIQHQVSSSDADYDGIVVGDVHVRIQDNDFNRDGVLNAKDIDHLFERLSKNSNDPRFDINQDNKLDSSDVDTLIGDVFGTNSGDANLDGTIDFADFLVVAGNFGKQGRGWAAGDFDGSGGTDFRDFLAIASNYGKRRR